MKKCPLYEVRLEVKHGTMEVLVTKPMLAATQFAKVIQDAPYGAAIKERLQELVKRSECSVTGNITAQNVEVMGHIVGSLSIQGLYYWDEDNE